MDTIRSSWHSAIGTLKSERGPAMAEKTNGRAERREEIKLRLEYLKVVISLGVIGTLLFAGLQWRMANQAALQTNDQRIVSEWRNHLATFVEKPLLRPYFEGRKKLTDDDPNREAVLALPSSM